MGAIPVFNNTGTSQYLGRFHLPPGKWADVPESLRPALNAMGGILFEDTADCRFMDDDGRYLGWSSPLYYSDGYGSIAQEIAAEFIRMGVGLSIWPRDYHPGHRNFGNLPLDRWHEAFVPQEIVECLQREQTPTLYGINMTWPPQLDQRPFPRCIGLTMFETTRPPEKWADPMNRCRRVVVPCAQNRDAFRSMGVTVPIEVVPLGVDPEKWPVIDRRRRDQPYTFLMSGGITHRKNPQMAAEAFAAAFPRSRRDVRLVIKTRGAGAKGFRDWAAQLPRDDRIEVVGEESTPDQMLGWMHRADAFVWPSRGEGFGLPPLQAMATGLPCIIADNSGMKEYIHRSCCIPVKCQEVKVPANADGGYPDSWGDCGNWWEPDFDNLVEAFRLCRYSRVQGIGRKAAQYVRDNFTVRHTCGRLLEVVMRDAREACDG